MRVKNRERRGRVGRVMDTWMARVEVGCVECVGRGEKNKRRRKRKSWMDIAEREAEGKSRNEDGGEKRAGERGGGKKGRRGTGYVLLAWMRNRCTVWERNHRSSNV